MKQYKVIGIIGKAGSGKDSLMKNLLQFNPSLNEIVSCTTRDPREGEVDGVNYHFLSIDEFEQKLMNEEMLEATVFNGWCYGTSYDSLKEDVINVGVFNPAGIESLSQYKNIDLEVFYIHASDKIRLIRQLNREENPNIEEIIRRYFTDKEDFMNLDIDYIEVYNESIDDFELATRQILFNVGVKWPESLGKVD